MTPQIINLGRRFGLAAPDIIKGRKKPSGMDWRGYNAANPGETQKDSRGRWTDNPVGRAIGQAYSNVRSAYGREWVGMADLREEIGGAYTRDEVDTELRRLGAGNGDPDITIVPEDNQKALSMRDRLAALMFGDQANHAIQMRHDDLPAPGGKPKYEPPSKAGEPLPGLATERQGSSWAASQGIKLDPAFAMDPSPFSPGSGRDPKQQTLGLLKDLGADTYDDWDDADLASLRAHAAALVARADAALKAKKAAARKPRTPKVTAKPGPRYEQMAADMRALPVLPESEGAAKRMLEPLTIPELKAFAGEAEVPVTSRMRKQELRDAIYNQLVGTRFTTDAVMNYGDRDRFDRRRAEAASAQKPGSQQERAMAALRQAGARDGETMGIEQLRAAMGGTRAEQDAILQQLNDERQINLLPQSNQKILTDERRAAAIHRGNEDKHVVMLGSQARLSPAPAAKVTAKPRTSKTREGSDLAATHAGLEREIMALEHADDGVEQAERRLSRMTMPQLREFAATLPPTVGKLPAKIAKGEAIRRIVGGTIGYRQRSEAINPGGVARRAQERASDGLDAKRRKLAELDAEVKNTPDMRAAQQAKLQADDLRREIGRIERGDDAAKVDQPREVTNRQITEKVAELVQETGRPYVSLVRLRAALPHIKHDEVTAALKELDRARIIQLDPDSDQKNVPLEAYEAAVVMGGQRRLLVSLIGGGGSA